MSTSTTAKKARTPRDSPLASLQGSASPPQTPPTHIESDPTSIWKPLADALARRAFVVLRIPTAANKRKLEDLTKQYTDILVQELTPATTENKLNLPISVFQFINERKCKLEEDAAELREATNSALQRGKRLSDY